MSRPATVVCNHWITLSDGVRLSSRLWLPFSFQATWECFGSEEDIEKLAPGDDVVEKVPVILEIIPYWKDVVTLERDMMRHTRFAQMGYAVCRAEIRGTGNSDGLYFDEYTEQEMLDCEEVIEYLGSRPWSNGHVAMFGKSWAGFNGLQMAARNPEHLSAVISLYSTDNRFDNDVHYLGGNIVGDGMVNWSNIMHAWNSRPPNPNYCKDWKHKWLHRLEYSSEPWLKKWMTEQDPESNYWKHGSIIYDYDKVKIPILAIGGIFDGYTDGAFRMASCLNEDSRVIIGPWGHLWPDTALPGPNIDFMAICDRWLKHHLRGINQSMDDWPRFTVYLRDSHLPSSHMSFCQGSWASFDAFDHSCHVGTQKLHNGKFGSLAAMPTSIVSKLYIGKPGSLDAIPEHGEPFEIELKPNFFQGFSSGKWMSWGYGEGIPGDQTIANGVSECWSFTVPNEVIICGYIWLKVKAKGKGQIAARLCGENKNGTSTLISYGVKSVSSAGYEDTMIQFKPTTYTVHRGMPVKLCLSGSWFPVIFPTSLSGSVSILAGGNSAELSIQCAGIPSQKTLDLGAPQGLFKTHKIEHDAGFFDEKTIVDMCTDDAKFIRTVQQPDVEFPGFQVRFTEFEVDEYISNMKVNRAELLSHRIITHKHDNHEEVKIDAKARMTHLDDHFQLDQSLKVEIGGDDFFSRSWSDVVSNRLV